MPAKPKGNHVFAKEIQELMKLKGWTQAELANELGIHESTVSLWIHDKRTPRGVCKRLLGKILVEAREEPRQEGVPA